MDKTIKSTTIHGYTITTFQSFYYKWYYTIAYSEDDVPTYVGKSFSEEEALEFHNLCVNKIEKSITDAVMKELKRLDLYHYHGERV